MTTRVLVGKVGLDGHDRGVKVVARTLRDAGFEVVYTGLYQTPESLVDAAVQEDVDVIGVSLLSGAHLTIVPEILARLHDAGAAIPLVVGGIVPPDDVPVLEEAGAAGVLTPGASSEDVVAVIRRAAGEASA